MYLSSANRNNNPSLFRSTIINKDSMTIRIQVGCFTKEIGTSEGCCSLLFLFKPLIL
nr:hypothetical protein [Methanobrevibacter arboriphilus]